MTDLAAGHPENSGISSDIKVSKDGRLHVNVSLPVIFSTFEITDRDLKRSMMMVNPDKYPLAKILYGEYNDRR